VEYQIAGRGMSVIWKDGNFLDGTTPTIFHDDGGFTNGLAVFDSMLAVDGILMDPRPHFDRLVHDAGVVLGISPSWLPIFETLSEAWLPLLAQNTLTKGPVRIRTTVTGGVSEKPLSVSEVPSVVITVARSGPVGNLPSLKCAVVKSHPRVVGDVLENCKRLDYTRAFAARRAAQNMGAEEAILTNTKEDVCCGSTSNLFIEEDGVLITPPLSEGVMAGVTRAKIIAEHGARQEPISEKRLRGASAVYLTNSFWGIRPATLV
jgi:branched-chain amino acid aminotransferase